MAVNLRGFDELHNDLARMADKLMEEGAVVNRALRAGAAPIEEQMKVNASSDPKKISGALHGAIHTRGLKKRRGGPGKQISIGVHRQDWHEDEYYPSFVEYGHGGPAPAPAHPYVRPAFDTRYPDAYNEMKSVLKEAIRK